MPSHPGATVTSRRARSALAALRPRKNWRDALAVAQRVAGGFAGLFGWLAYISRVCNATRERRRPDAGGGTHSHCRRRKKFPDEAVIAYNLSCYACQLNELDASRVWLKRAIKTGGKDAICKMALEDDDLKPLWPEIEAL